MTSIENMEMICVNACADAIYCFMLQPYYTCGHVMCFNPGMAINSCVQCGCKKSMSHFVMLLMNFQ